MVVYMGKIVLIDGHSMLHRAFYGVPDLSNGEGLHTNAIYGFLNIMFKILEEEKPEYLAVAFDVHAPTFRHEIYTQYKGTRKPMPEELREQIPVMKEVLAAMGIKTVEQPGLEADDILGTLAKRSEKEGMEVSLISGDRDLLQIASERIKIRIPKTKGGKTEIEDYYAADVEAKYQVNPVQFIDLKALMGDTADNIPGVPKVGEKTATELMVKFGSLEEIYNHIDEISKKSVRESLAANKELADLSKVLATIKVDGEIVFAYEEAKIGDFYTEDSYKIFTRLGFKNMLSRFEKGGEKNKQAEHFREVTDFGEAEKIFQRLQGLKQGERAAFEIIEDSSREEDFVGLALAFGEEEVYFLKPEGFLKKDYLTGRLSEAISNVSLVTFDIKKKYGYIKTDCTERLFDILIAAYLLDRKSTRLNSSHSN